MGKSYNIHHEQTHVSGVSSLRKLWHRTWDPFMSSSRKYNASFPNEQLYIWNDDTKTLAECTAISRVHTSWVVHYHDIVIVIHIVKCHLREHHICPWDWVDGPPNPVDCCVRWPWPLGGTNYDVVRLRIESIRLSSWWFTGSTRLFSLYTSRKNPKLYFIYIHKPQHMLSVYFPFSEVTKFMNFFPMHFISIRQEAMKLSYM